MERFAQNQPKTAEIEMQNGPAMQLQSFFGTDRFTNASHPETEPLSRWPLPSQVWIN
jgi:hypothetical protein